MTVFRRIRQGRVIRADYWTQSPTLLERKHGSLSHVFHQIRITCNSIEKQEMKVNGNGQGAILTPEELRLLFTEGFTNPRDRSLFAICLFTGCRVSEALALQTTDIKGGTITFRKSTTKGKLKTRVVDIQPGLAKMLSEYQPKPGALFPGMRGVTEHLTRFAADKILKDACTRVGFVGVSTHSFRRTALTMMSSAGVPLRHIQEISGHNDLGTLQRYLEVTPEQRKKAVSVIGF